MQVALCVLAWGIASRKAIGVKIEVVAGKGADGAGCQGCSVCWLVWYEGERPLARACDGDGTDVRYSLFSLSL